MATQKRRLKRYLTLYALTILVATISLSINIKTVPLNKAIQGLSKQKRQLLEQNQDLLHQLLSITKLSEVERIATQELHMKKPYKARYVRVKRGSGNEN